jgi:hypothetical protein
LEVTNVEYKNKVPEFVEIEDRENVKIIVNVYKNATSTDRVVMIYDKVNKTSKIVDISKIPEKI